MTRIRDTDVSKSDSEAIGSLFQYLEPEKLIRPFNRVSLCVFAAIRLS
ncbi:MAG: hypothetical protein DF168_00179 [Candidatus Moanabacter tarae]|uniref:Uncharacterized protein n=1 Tax=Candidatus Moanibacter tarae TaxID=2200854 RepID=A0A2Z4AGE6_9BACT|nr:MAG: hypothetical protein DF168_00179 [Candidatus Moanabacter tarae]